MYPLRERAAVVIGGYQDLMHPGGVDSGMQSQIVKETLLESGFAPAFL